MFATVVLVRLVCCVCPNLNSYLDPECDSSTDPYYLFALKLQGCCSNANPVILGDDTCDVHTYQTTKQNKSKHNKYV